MAEPAGPLDDALAQLERGRRDRWIVGALLVVAVVGALVLLLVADDVTTERSASWAAAGFLAVSLVYGASVVAEERRARRAVRALVTERERAVALAARAEALETLDDAVREVTAAGDLVEVFSRLLAAARRLAGADAGAVLLRTGDVLVVAASEGPGAAPVGTRLPRGQGPAWAAVSGGDTVQTGRGGAWGPGGDRATVAAPLALPGRIVGALVVERGPDAPAFSGVDLLAVRLFAQHAALAVRNATRLDEERRHVATLQTAGADRAAAVAGYAHDLGAPLSAISGYAQLLRERDEHFTPERRRALLGDVAREVERLRGLIDGLVRAASVEAGVPVEAEEVDLAVLAHDLARTARAAAHDQRAAREVVVDAPEPVVVSGDPEALRRVVANLLDNAIGHSPPGSPVEVGVTCAGGRAVLVVRDHGPGIDPEQLEHVLGPFARGEGGGTGLGLHVVRTLVDAHGGEVVLSNAEGGGLEARVTLPPAGASGEG